MRPLRQVTAAPGAPFWRQALESDVVNLAHSPDKRVHAVIDGAFFDDLPKLLANHNLAACPLFTGNTPQALVNAGPWLVDLYHGPFDEPDELEAAAPDLSDEALALQAAAMAEDMRRLVEAGDETGGLPQKSDEDNWTHGAPADPAAQIRKLINLAADKPALIFWTGSADLTPTSLYKHLRSLNMMLVPDDERPGETQAVQFRHADGNVLASVLPVLDEHQFARLFGPALALTFHSPDFPDKDGWPVRRAVHPLGTAQAQAGMLALTVEQMRGVEAARIERLKRRLHAYLIKVSPESSKALSSATMDSQIDESVRSALSLGLKSEPSFRRWAYLMHVSQGRIGGQADILDFVRHGKTPAHVEKSGKPVPANPDDRMTAAFEQTIAFFERARSNRSQVKN